MQLFRQPTLENIINFFTSKNNIILDPFAGRTRATISNYLGRKYIGFELTEKYFPQTIGEDLPEGFQRSEFLLEKGFIDHIVSRNEIKSTLSDLLSFFDFGGNNVTSEEKNGE